MPETGSIGAGAGSQRRVPRLSFTMETYAYVLDEVKKEVATKTRF